VIVNPNPDLGRTGSIQCGIESIGIQPMLIVPVDRPGFSQYTVKKLCECNDTTIPTFNEKGGHPIAITSQDCENILAAESDIPLREIISPDRLIVEDPHLHLNIDTKEDVNELFKVAKYL
jgi:molybdenum cofactor cytidylyltransferase